MKFNLVTIVYEEDLAGGWDIYYYDRDLQKIEKKTFLWGDEEEMFSFLKDLLPQMNK